MKIEMLIDELQEIVDDAFTLPLSGGKTVVNTERLKEIIEDMRINLPIEVKQAKSIAADRTNILNESRAEAENLVQEAEERSKSMVEQAEEKSKNMVKQAEEKSKNMVKQAEEKSKAMVKQADEKSKAMIQQSEIVRMAQQQAQQILDSANQQAFEIKNAANIYIDNMMKKADDELSKNLAEVKKTRQSLKNYQQNQQNNTAKQPPRSTNAVRK